jgi:hypothetical protein
MVPFAELLDALMHEDNDVRVRAEAALARMQASAPADVSGARIARARKPLARATPLPPPPPPRAPAARAARTLACALTMPLSSPRHRRSWWATWCTR